jgi:D-alanyl-D-alanine carboxypeptidase
MHTRPDERNTLKRTLLISVIALAGLAAAAAFNAAPAPAASPLPAQLDGLVAQFTRAHPGFPGVVLAVRTPTLTWTGAFGVADRATRKPLAADAGFRIASVTKTFTAAAILRLVEQGKLALDDPIAHHLSRASVALLRRGGYKVDRIHVRHLLQHTSGLYDYAEDPAFQAFVVSHPRHRWTRAEQVRFAMTHGKPLFPPGTSFRYADTGYVLLGEMLERETGRSLAAAYRTLLGFGRLGLHHTYLETLEPVPAPAETRAHQYLGATDTAAFDPSFDLYGGGGLVSTVDDLARFYRALLGGRVFEKAATLRTMLGKAAATRPVDLGMGIFAESVGRESCWHHDGFWGTSVLHCPRTGVTIAVTVDQAADFAPAVQRLNAKVLRLVNRT